MDNINIPAPNQALGAILMGSPMRRLMQEKTEIAQAFYVDEVTKRTGQLARAARVETFVGGLRNDRWCGRLIVDSQQAEYAASHEYGVDDGDARVTAGAHDLNMVLNMMGGL